MKVDRPRINKYRNMFSEIEYIFDLLRFNIRSVEE